MMLSNRLLLIKLLIIGFTWSFSSHVFAGKVAAKRNKVKIYSKASKSGSVLKTLKKGDIVETKDRKGMYWEVLLDGGEIGFVSVMKVKRKSSGKKSNISAALRSAAQKSRKDGDASNIRARSAVMGVRGLDESSDTAFAGNVKPNLRSVYNMENFLVEKSKVAELESLIEKEISAKMRGK